MDRDWRLKECLQLPHEFIWSRLEEAAPSSTSDVAGLSPDLRNGRLPRKLHIEVQKLESCQLGHRLWQAVQGNAITEVQMLQSSQLARGR